MDNLQTFVAPWIDVDQRYRMQQNIEVVELGTTYDKILNESGRFLQKVINISGICRKLNRGTWFRNGIF
jgi:hypothetical protein